ncbi:MAG TPA: hypothetical protein VJT68_07725 [Thermoleophilaceae bacterium]|nr:hypothetical protein [Thermoleophilaceae bacterium]
MRRGIIGAATGVIGMLAAAGPAFAQSDGTQPAGGAAIGEAIGATAGALLATALVVWLISRHRGGRTDVLNRFGEWAERHTGLPAWASVPSMLLGVSLLVAVLGMYWDISLHIDNGRDPGPLANPAHYLILVGLYGVLVAGVMSIVLSGTERPVKTAIHLGGDWWAPVGGLMMAACGAFALSGFPLDDMWHRLFGQDVTLWGPTHLMLIGGASLATLGGMVLMGEAITAIGRDPEREGSPTVYHTRRALLVGGFLVALTTFQAEFDFGVPQFREVYQPILIMFAAGIGLVTCRLFIGRGGAILAVAGYLVIRGFLAIMVGVVWGEVTPHFPLYIVEALLVEAVFLRAGGRSPVVNGAIAGALIGTIGLAAEWAWSHIWMPIPWNDSLLPEAAIAGFITAVAGGIVGGFIGGSLVGKSGALISREDGARLTSGDRRAALAGGLVLMAVIGWALPLSTTGPARAQVALRDIQSGPQRTVAATFKLDPPDSVKDPEFLNVTAWQGGQTRVLDPLEQVGPGEYRTTKPIPVHGSWKSTLRMQQGDALISMPIFLPEDKAIPAKEVPAEASFTRGFLKDKKVLQREQKQGVPGFLTLAAYLTVLAIALALIALIAWSLLRVDRGEARSPRAGGRTRRTRAELVR